MRDGAALLICRAENGDARGKRFPYRESMGKGAFDVSLKKVVRQGCGLMRYPREKRPELLLHVSRHGWPGNEETHYLLWSEKTGRDLLNLKILGPGTYL